ncbi:MAG: hypothetical protein DYG89_15860 [Caldilinea sp. CFX5]|nr:hypothetical protein [Caldilinea sp. CFX5]
MNIIIQNIADYAAWIYFACGVIALYQLYRTWLVRAERRQAVFSLEREKAVRDLGNIFSTALVLLLIMGVTYFTSTTLVKALAASLPTTAATVADDFGPGLNFPTPTYTPSSATLIGTPVASTPAALAQTTVITAAETPTPEAVTPTVIPPTATPAPIVQAPACPDQRAVILRPGTNETVSGSVSMVGTATHENFQYYKVEYVPAGAGNFSYLAGDKNPVVNGFLATINTNTLGNGAWTLQLTVVDQTGNWPPPCQVTIVVNN